MEVQNQPDPEELRLRALELGLPEEADQEAIENEELRQMEIPNQPGPQIP
jgi:hypothetical protein